MKEAGLDVREAAPRPRAKKSLGQHFLEDGRVLARIVRAADLSPDDLVIEVGPGRGALTRVLASRVRRLVTVEMDRELVRLLRSTFAGVANVSVLEADARELDIDALIGADEAYKVVANLPYYAASPIIRRFLEATHKPALMVVMLQREVAQAVSAQPGKMTLPSVGVQLYGRPRVLFWVPPSAFRPPPKVTSAVVRIDVYQRPLLSLDSEEAFFRLVRAGFSAPRKQLRNSLSHGLAIPGAEIEGLLGQEGIDPRRRAETLSVEEWGTLYNLFKTSLPSNAASC